MLVVGPMRYLILYFALALGITAACAYAKATKPQKPVFGWDAGAKQAAPVSPSKH